MANRIVINGKQYSGSSLSIINGRVTIDGVPQGGEAVSGVVEVRILEGIVHELHTDVSVTCQNVSGNVNAGGSVSCGAVLGSVNAGGSIHCSDVGGQASAGGSVHRS